MKKFYLPITIFDVFEKNLKGPIIKNQYYIRPVPKRIAIEMVIQNHYLHRKPQLMEAFGLIDKKDKEIVGIITYGTPPSYTLAEGVCGSEEKNNLCELNRLWVNDNLPRNCESFLIGNTLKMQGKEIIVSYADADQGHIGYVYQATNWLYTGVSLHPILMIDGKVVTRRDATRHCNFSDLKKKYGDRFQVKESKGKHRYIFFNADKKRKKELRYKLRYEVLPYPKIDLVSKTV